jgi:hypothetical protein
MYGMMSNLASTQFFLSLLLDYWWNVLPAYRPREAVFSLLSSSLSIGSSFLQSPMFMTQKD